MLFIWRGSVLPKVMPRLLFFLALTIVIYIVREALIAHHVILNPIAFTFFGVALALFLGFRNNASYDRFWEGRKLWGALVIDSRSLARQVSTLTSYNSSAPEILQFQKYLVSFPYTLMRQLRGEDPQPDLDRIFDNGTPPEIKNACFKPVMITKAMGDWLRQAKTDGKIDNITQAQIDTSINKLSEIIGGCERISNTPLPYSYSVLLHRTVYIYCFLLPFGLVETMDWFMPIVVMFVAYMFIALEAIAEELEDPFGTEPNDLALHSLCTTIEETVLEINGHPYERSPSSNEYYYIT